MDWYKILSPNLNTFSTVLFSLPKEIKTMIGIFGEIFFEWLMISIPFLNGIIKLVIIKSKSLLSIPYILAKASSAVMTL